jgi:hypothetical protein
MLNFFQTANQTVRMPASISASVRSRNTEECGLFPAMAALPTTFYNQLCKLLATESVIKSNTWKVQLQNRDASTHNHKTNVTDLNNTYIFGSKLIGIRLCL